MRTFGALLIVVAAGASGATCGAWSAGLSAPALWRALDVPIPLLAALAAMSCVMLGADALRVWTLARAVGVPLGLRGSAAAAWVEVFFSSVSPAAALGAPASMVVLRRHGVPWEIGLLVAFGKGATSVIFIVSAAVLVRLTGLVPQLSDAFEGRLVFTALMVVASFMALPVLMALAPRWLDARVQAFAAWVGAREQAASRLRRALGRAVGGVGGVLVRAAMRLNQLGRADLRSLAVVLLGHALYFGVQVGMGVALAYHFGAPDPWALVPLFIAFLGLVYVLPTPGGAGLSEAMAMLFFGAVVGKSAVALTLLFRIGSFYLPLLVTAAYTLVAAPWVATRPGRVAAEACAHAEEAAQPGA